MSYARFGADGSDVYVFLSSVGHLECCACPLVEMDGGLNAFTTTDAMLHHLDIHERGGDVVPENTRQSLIRDRVENDAWIADREQAAS